MAVVCVSDKPGVRDVQVTCFISVKTEEYLNYHGLRNQDGLTKAQKINQIINEGLVKSGMCDLE